MAWIESHDSLGEHPKVFELCAELKIDKPTAIGLLHLIWHFTLKFAWKDGNLSKFSNAAIAKAICWEKDPDELIAALEKTRWIDNKKIHDWHHFTGRLIKDRLRYKKANAIRTESRRVQSVIRSQPYLTLPNHNKNIAPAKKRPVHKTVETVDKPKKEPTPFWKEMTEHIHETWKAKKKAPLFLKPQEYKTLKSLANTYQPWGIMSLWDDFLASTNDWVRSTGYSFGAFVSHIPTLVDNYGWKNGAKHYEAKLHHPVSALPANSPPEVIQKALDSIIKRP